MGWEPLCCKVVHLSLETELCATPSPFSSSLLFLSPHQEGWDGGLIPRLTGASRAGDSCVASQADVVTGASLDRPHVLCVLGTLPNLSELWFRLLKIGPRSRRPYLQGAPTTHPCRAGPCKREPLGSPRRGPSPLLSPAGPPSRGLSSRSSTSSCSTASATGPWTRRSEL